MSVRTPLASVLLVAISCALVGCISATPFAPTDPTASSTPVGSALGEVIEGTGYTLRAPDGWVVPPDAPPAADVYLIDEDPNANGFVNTLSIIVGPAPGEALAEIEAGGVAYLTDVVGAGDVRVGPRVAIAGSTAVHVSAQMNNGALYRLEQFILLDAGVAYTITFSLRQAMSQGTREALAQSVFDTWAWASQATSAPRFEDPDAQFAITFPDRPTLTVTDSGGMRATHSTEDDFAAPSAVVYTARGTTTAEQEITPETLESMFFQLINRGAALTGPEEKFELEGMPALMNSFTDSAGKPATMVLAGEGHRLYQLIVIGGTTEERQAFFDSFTLLD